MDEKCPIHPLNKAKRYDVFEGGVKVQSDVLACDMCIRNTPWLIHRPVEVRTKARVPNNMVAASAEKYE